MVSLLHRCRKPSLRSCQRTLCTLLLGASFSLPLLAPSAAEAQSAAVLQQRLDAMEQQIEILKSYRAPAPERETPVRTNAPAASTARFEVALTKLEEELRFLRGKIEEQEFAIRSATDQFTKLEQDMDMRMLALEERKVPAENPPVIGDDAEPSAAEDTPEPVAADSAETTSETTKADDRFNNSSEHYDAAFKALNQSRFDEAAELFESFIAAYPKDDLVGNAYYWLGETYYVQRQYEPAAEQFRSGFEAMPKGAKAPDNLLKLGMSLSLLERRDEACVVLSQLLKKFPDSSDAVKRKAAKESGRLKCK